MSTSNETPEAPVTVSTNDAVVSPPVTTNEFAAVEDKPETTEIAPATTDNDTATATAPVNDAEGIAQKGKQKETLSESVKEQDDAIGPAQDEIKAPTSEPNSPPVCNITLLLTTGSRHPYKLDAKYLTRRNVAIPENTEQGQPDPFSISIYTLKELILREWRSDWEAKPASPSSIRLIHFGKLLDDKEPLRSKPSTCISTDRVC